MNTNTNISSSPCAIRRIIQLSEAIVFQPIKVYDNFNINVTETCRFAWSTDGACWSPWATYAQYVKICKNVDGDFYLRILIFGGLGRLELSGEITECYTICLDPTNQFLYDFCSNPNLFQPYSNLDCALLLQQQLTNTAICMLGIPVYYLRVAPNNESVDYSFKEWVLHNVVDVKQIKMIVPDGTMPSSNPKLTEFDFDWENDWEVQIGKAAFAGAFGDTAFPKQRDLVYVPLMKRLWEVNSAYDEKNEGLLWRPTTWHLAMVKYNEKSNVDLGSFDGLVDSWIVNKYPETFGELEDNEQARESGTPQLESPKFAATNLYNLFTEDSIRAAYSDNSLTVIASQLCHHHNLFAHDCYRPSGPDACVTYQKGLCGDEGMLSFIIGTPQKFDAELTKNIVEFGELTVGLSGGELSVCGRPELTTTLETGTNYMILITWNKANYTLSLDVFLHTYDHNMPVYKVRPELYWIDFENPVFHGVGAYNDDLSSTRPQPCRILPYPCGMTNIKYYNRVLGEQELYSELVKYTTDDDRCVINDLARPILSGHGYAVR